MNMFFDKKSGASVAIAISAVFVFIAAFSASGTTIASAQQVQNLGSDRTTLNISDKGFRIVVCDGPAYAKQPADYVPCDFDHMMLQIQHLIDIMMVLGTIVAIFGFCYAGYLYISVSFTGKEGNVDQAKSIFWHVLVGFAIMIVAWFVVYQILDWLGSNDAFKTLLGSPS